MSKVPDTKVTDDSQFPHDDFRADDFRATATAFSTVTGVLGGFCITILVLVISKEFLTDKPIEVKNWIIGLLLIGAFVYLTSSGLLANSMNAIKFKDTTFRQIIFKNAIFLFHLGNLFLVAAVYVLISNVLSSNEVLWGLNAILKFIVIAVLIIASYNFIKLVVIAWIKVVIAWIKRGQHTGDTDPSPIVVTATFSEQTKADHAVEELKQAGFTEDQISSEEQTPENTYITVTVKADGRDNEAASILSNNGAKFHPGTTPSGIIPTPKGNTVLSGLSDLAKIFRSTGSTGS